jgi:acyl-CoA synthetase (AMP-forming)/AMP-acid ligase II
MNNLALLRNERSASSPVLRSAVPDYLGRLADAPTFQRLEGSQFLAMQCAYARNGGLASGDEVAQLLRWRSEQPISTLARWIVARTIVSFEWQSQTLIPLFQFDPSDMSPSAATVDVIRELSDVFDDWELASWFAQPNVWLHDAAPVVAIRKDQLGVLQAARADRFIARG